MNPLPSPWRQAAAATAVVLACSTTHAHEGHGMPGSQHWHASDVWGLVLVVAVALVVAWRGRR